MPQPTQSDLHVNRPLTNISIAYLQEAKNFIANRVFPIVPVSKQSDIYFLYPISYWTRSEAQKRAPGTESAGSGWSIDKTNTYFCDPIAVHKDIDDQVRGNQDAPIDFDRDATEWVTQQLLLKREKDWVTDFFATSKWTGGTSADPVPSPTWGLAASTPIEDVTAQAVSIMEKTGRKPNKLVLGPEVYDKLRNHPDVLDRVKYTQRGIVTLDLLAAVFDVDEVLVPWATENDAAEDATASMDFVYGKHALLVYSAPSPGILQPSGGYTFAWNGYVGAGREGNRISKFRMDNLRCDRVEGEMAYDFKVIGADLGCFFSGAVA